ncbi:hypothetical protein RclHR1_31220001 [Rhizophagus clarus]|uniref:Uncharacterized protein n=1 Tax=Rhizophagus clarus TaxID=94130 RepID=A0A2Z6R6M0_9GLOM|nr:hypothetical protein RclHR1_31220001 [Rhizophagus clarus]
MVNREGKQLNYYQSFLRGKKYDERCYKTIEIHNKAGVSYTHRDRSEIKRTLVLPAVNSCKSKNQVIIMVVNQNYHLSVNHNSIVFTTKLQLIFKYYNPPRFEYNNYYLRHATLANM